MPRADYLQQVNELIDLAPALRATTKFGQIRKGDEDGMVILRFDYQRRKFVELSILMQELRGYPSRHTGYCFVDTEHADKRAYGVENVIAEIQVDGRPLCGVVNDCMMAMCIHFGVESDSLRELLYPLTIDTSTGRPQRRETSSESEVESEMDDETDDSSAQEFFSSHGASHGILTSKLRLVLRDATQLKACGYGYVGYCSRGFESGLSVGQLVKARLLTVEQCAAYDLGLSHYIITLMKFTPEYLEILRTENGCCHIKGYQREPGTGVVLGRRSEVQFRVLAGRTEQLRAGDAFQAFQAKMDETNKSDSNGTRALTAFLLSWTLTDILNHRFLSILSYALEHNLGWQALRAGAEAMYELQLTTAGPPIVGKHIRDFDSDELLRRRPKHTFPDNFRSVFKPPTPALDDQEYMSFPLLTMRYVLRKLVSANFEVLKPFVCDSSLCTFQYLSFGIGPSIELEILHHPTVVDLLVSLAYAAAANKRLNPFPVGIESAKVIRSAKEQGHITSWNGSHFAVEWFSDLEFDVQPGHMIEYRYGTAFLRAEIVAIPSPNHLRIAVAGRPSNVFSYTHIPFWVSRKAGGWATDPSSALGTQLEETDQIVRILNQLPSICDMADALRKQLGAHADAQDRMELDLPDSPTSVPNDCTSLAEKRLFDTDLLRNQHTLTLQPALDQIHPLLYPLLRWIICSNRSYICELSKEDQMIAGVSKLYLQFKMVMSSPDKEEAFVKAQKAQKAKIKSLWAFHGSPLYNWHSILRTGLHFDNVVHGRAYGHGIYHALDSTTSHSYAKGGLASWPQSKIGILSCISLNEIINCPKQFASTSPYLVVPNKDWVQTRYLLVGRNGTTQDYSHASPHARDQRASAPNHVTQQIAGVDYYEMDSHFIPSDTHFRLTIPRFTKLAPADATGGLSDNFMPPYPDDPGLTMLAQELQKEAQASSELHLSSDSEDDSVLNEDLDKSAERTSDSLSLASPEYATATATKAILRELKNMLRIQEETKVESRGWTLQTEGLINLYQWSVTMSHFSPDLLLAQQLKARRIDGISMEIRFNHDFPFSPPYIRVITPRFLPFSHGGGGHITAGGSVCMDLLTLSGWSASYNMESVLLQVRMALESVEPQPAQLARNYNAGYGAQEALQAYRRVAQHHGWRVPGGLERFGN
ncbi:hypothetical protein HDU85_006571 [Gaertneriomyces sp. JEL0708]|nr:hypothetical protein HDU85_006571 [Gaertneriomyces sp. JEL0708]